jgi:pimeloyl-ACP methyl ester carboxylesterase
VTAELLTLDIGDGVVLRGEQWPGDGAPIVLLHSGVTDRRSWRDTAAALGPRSVVAYDRRGVGDSDGVSADFRHVDDLRRVLDVVAPGNDAVLVGSSMGGGVALDLAVLEPDRVRTMVLFAPAVSGAPEVEQLDADTQRLSDLIDAAFESGDLDEINRLEMWLWLDGPASPEGRVSGAARDLAHQMNAALLRRDRDEHAGGSGLDAWGSLEQIRARTTVVCGDLDLPFFAERCRTLVRRIPDADYVELAGRAHLPYLEDPEQCARMIEAAVRDN